MKAYNDYLSEATVVCQKTYGNMSPEFTKASKELVAEGLLIHDAISKVLEKQDELINIQTQILEELKKSNTKEVVKSTTTAKTTTTTKK